MAEARSGGRHGDRRWFLTRALVAAPALSLALRDAHGGAGAAPAPLLGPGEERITFSDPRLESNPFSRLAQTYIPRNGPLAAVRQDPKFNREFRLRCVVRTSEAPGADPDTRFYVHFLAAEDEALARRVARVLAHLYWIGWEYLGVSSPARETPVDVWLCRDGRPGAEEFQNDIYLYAVGDDRAPAEWIRELAHEYSHIVIPPYGPFTEPEKLANGYMGERLLMKWLVDNQLTDVWGPRFVGASYVANQVTPLVERFLNAGPNAAAGRHSGAVGMEHLIGLALALDAAFGPRFLREAMRRATGTGPQSLGAGAAEAMRALYDRELRLDARAYIPDPSAVDASGLPGVRGARAAYWVFLPAGRWAMSVVGPAIEGLSAQIEDGRMERMPNLTAGSANFQATVLTAGWRRLTVAARPGGRFEIAHFRLQRAQP